MFSCRHFSDFLSDPIGNQSAMSERGQEAISNEGSPKAKPKPVVPAKARPLNLVSRRPWSEKNSSQNLGYLVNPGNADERKGVEIATGKLLQIASKSEVGYSQVSRQENALKAQGNLCVEQLQKQLHQRAHSNSNSSGQSVQGATPNQYFPALTKEVGIYSSLLNFLHGSIFFKKKLLC